MWKDFFKGIAIAFLVMIIMVGIAQAVALIIQQGGTGAREFSPNSIIISGSTATTSALSATSSPTVGWVHATTTGATSTFLGGLYGAAGIRFDDLVSCDTINTDANGFLVCGSDATGSGVDEFTYTVASPFTYLTPTSTAVGLLGSASSTFVRLSSSISTSTEATSTYLRVSTLASVFDLITSNITSGGILISGGSGLVTGSGVLTNGQLLIGDGSGAPTAATLTGTANEIGITNGAGSITIGIPNPATLTNLTITNSTTTSATTTKLYVSGGLGVGISTSTTGVIETSGVINVGGSGTSTFVNGINATTGCFAIAGVCVGGGGGTPGGADTEVQYNNASAFGGMSQFTYASPTLTVSSAGTLNMNAAGTLRIPVSASSTMTLTGELEIDTGNTALHFNSGGTERILPALTCFGTTAVNLPTYGVVQIPFSNQFPYVVTEVQAKSHFTATTSGQNDGTGNAYTAYGWQYNITHGTAQTQAGSSTVLSTTFPYTSSSTWVTTTSGFNDDSAAADELWWLVAGAASSSVALGTTTPSLIVRICGYYSP